MKAFFPFHLTRSIIYLNTNYFFFYICGHVCNFRKFCKVPGQLEFGFVKPSHFFINLVGFVVQR